LLLDFHGFACIAHHALDVEVEQLPDELVEGVVF
jgi:hypothetical protein